MIRKNKIVLVTGGAGFVGSHLSEKLKDLGHYVLVLDNFTTGKNKIDGVEYIQGDIRDLETVRDLVKEVDEVYHLAAAVGVKYVFENPEYSFEANVIGSYNVMKSCLFYSKPCVFVSSSAVYGKSRKSEKNEDDDVTFGAPQNQEWHYSFQKGVMDGLFCYLGKKTKLFKVIRLFNCIGKNQVGYYGMVVPRFINWALKNEPILVYGDGKQTRTFIDVRDAVRGIILVAEKGEYGEPYNVGGEEEISILELAKLIKKLTKSKSPIRLISYKDAFGKDNFDETRKRKPNIDKIKKLGFEINYNLEDTILWILGEKE